MRTLFILMLALQASLASAATVAGTLKAWLKEQAPAAGLLQGEETAQKSESVFDACRPPVWDLGAERLEGLGLPLSLPGGLKGGYAFRQGIVFPYGQAYLLHYQEGEPESDDHWFRLCRRQKDGTAESLLEFGTCIGETRLLKLGAEGPRFLLLVESACGSRLTLHLLRLDAKDPLRGAMKLQGRESDLRLADLDGDGQLELIQRSWEAPPAALGLRLELASDHRAAKPVMLWLSTAWRWSGEAWVRAGERWQEARP